jgi:hypothetical protein
MNQDTEEDQMQCGGRNGILRAARGRSDGFAYCVYALSPDVEYFKFCGSRIAAVGVGPICDVL